MLPLVVILCASLTASQFLSFPLRGLTLGWYTKVLADPSYVAAFATSSTLAAAATLAALALGVPAALVIGRHAVPGSRIIGAVLMSPLVLPHVVLGAAFPQYCAGIRLVRTFWALLLGHVVVVTPFDMQAVLPLLTPEQRALEEASRDLGAGPVPAR